MAQPPQDRNNTALFHLMEYEDDIDGAGGDGLGRRKGMERI
jgi:hypothetical protein